MKTHLSLLIRFDLNNSRQTRRNDLELNWEEIPYWPVSSSTGLPGRDLLVPFIRILTAAHLSAVDDLIRSGALGRASLSKYHLARVSDDLEALHVVVPMYRRAPAGRMALSVWDDKWLATV